LEVEKLRRGELEWLQVLVNILDHIFALHAAAVRSGDAKFTAPITTFQNACRDTARRLGLTPFAAETNEPFDAERHQVAGSKETPPAGAVVAETIGSGYTFQGRLLRPALVRLRDGKRRRKRNPQNPLPPRHPRREMPERVLARIFGLMGEGPHCGVSNCSSGRESALFHAKSLEE